MLQAICFCHVAVVECGGTDCVRPAQRAAGEEAGRESSLASFSPVFRQHYIPSDSGKARLKAELRYRLEIKKKEPGSHCRATHDMQVFLQEFFSGRGNHKVQLRCSPRPRQPWVGQMAFQDLLRVCKTGQMQLDWMKNAWSSVRQPCMFG